MRAAPALALAVLLAAGCGIGPEDAARPLSSEEVPPGVLADRTSSAQPAGEREQRLYFLRDGQLVPVVRPAAQVTPETVLADLLGGPLPPEQDRGLSTALPSGGEPGLVALTGRSALVDLGDRLLESGRDDQVTALAQVVLSLTALREVETVRFVQDGAPVDVPRADGQVVDVPLRGEDYRDLLDAP